MSAFQFRYFLYNLYNLRFIREVPIQGVKFASELNSAGEFTGTIKLTDKGAYNAFASIIPGQTALAVWYNGTLSWGGIIWTKEYTRSTASAELGGSEFWSYAVSRVQAADYTSTWATTATDPLVIAKTVTQDVLNFNEAGTNNLYSPPFTVATVGGPQPSGNFVTVSYPKVQYQTLDSIVSSLAGMGYEGGGFDFTTQVYWGTDNQTLNVEWLYSYPRAGRIWGQNGWVPSIDVSSAYVTDFDYPIDATQQANWLHEKGMGNVVLSGGNDPATAQVMLEAAPTHTVGDTPSEVMLGNWLLADASTYGEPAVAPVVTVRSDTPGFEPGQIAVGDDLRVVVPPGDPNWPAGWNVVFRVARFETTVNKEGVPVTVYTLNVPPVVELPAFVPPL